MPPLDDSYSFRSIPRRPPQVPHVSFPPSTCHFYYKRFRVVIGLRLVLQPYPRLQPVNDFCSSGQRFALGLVGSPNPASFRFHLTMDTLAFGYVLPTTGRTPDLHRLETCAAGRTTKKVPPKGYFSIIPYKLPSSVYQRSLPSNCCRKRFHLPPLLSPV